MIQIPIGSYRQNVVQRPYRIHSSDPLCGVSSTRARGISELALLTRRKRAWPPRRSPLYQSLLAAFICELDHATMRTGNQKGKTMGCRHNYCKNWCKEPKVSVEIVLQTMNQSVIEASHRLGLAACKRCEVSMVQRFLFCKLCTPDLPCEHGLT